MKVVVHFDGCARPRSGRAACAAIVFDEAGETLTHVGRPLAEANAGVAAWSGLIAGLRAARELGADHVLVRGDSRMVIQQSFAGHLHDVKYEPLHREIRSLISGFQQCSGEQVDRDRNAAAEQLCSSVLDGTYRPFGIAGEVSKTAATVSFVVTMQLPRSSTKGKAESVELRRRVTAAIEAAFPVSVVDVKRIG